MAIPLRPLPSFTVVRAQSGAVAVDPTTLSLANYPLDQLAAASLADEASFYWTQTGGNITDTIDIQVLIYDSENMRYLNGGTTGSITQNTVALVRVYGGLFAVRINAKTSTGSDARIYSASTYPAPPRG